MQSMMVNRTAEQIGAIVYKLKAVRKGSFNTVQDRQQAGRKGKPKVALLKDWRHGRDGGAYFLGYTIDEVADMFHMKKASIYKIPLGGIETREQLAKFRLEHGYTDYAMKNYVNRTELAELLDVNYHYVIDYAAARGIKSNVKKRSNAAFTPEQVKFLVEQKFGKKVS